jgi:imidazolonepropionase
VSDLLLTGIGHLTTNAGEPLHDAVVAVSGGRITFAGPAGDAPYQSGADRIDCEQGAVLPGFVDPHTHIVFAGDRAIEFARRLRGATYAEIAAQGGGILSTVDATRSATDQTLFELAAERARRMIHAGTTVLEVKSGYGLDIETEIRLLEIGRRLGDELPVTVRTTFLGAHAVPPEFRGDREGYLDLVIEEMLPAVAGLADYCDVFVEDGAFTVDEGRRVLEAGLTYGMTPRVHAEQMSHTGGAMLAADLGSASADHLDHATEEDAEALAAAGVVAVLTPGTSYSMRTVQAPGVMLRDHGVTIALATDCNPGTSYFESMGLVISLAVVEMGLTVEEAIHAATRGGALALGLTDRGLVEPGAVADLVILDAPDPAHLAYRPATNLVTNVIRDGVRIV